MVRFSIYPPVQNEPCLLECTDGNGRHRWEMRGEPEYTSDELRDLEPDTIPIFREWLRGAQQRFRESLEVKGGIYSAESNGGNGSVRD